MTAGSGLILPNVFGRSDMSRIPGASPISTDIAEIRRRGEDDDRSLPGDDAHAVPEPVPGERPEREDEADRGGS